MRTLYHLWLCPFARKVRIVLAEKKLPFELEIEKVWERREEFLALNPAGEVPVHSTTMVWPLVVGTVTSCEAGSAAPAGRQATAAASCAARIRLR